MSKEPTDLVTYLHKGPVQVLSSAVLRLSLLKKQVTDPSAQAAVTQIEEEIKQAITELQTLMSQLRGS